MKFKLQTQNLFNKAVGVVSTKKIASVRTIGRLMATLGIAFALAGSTAAIAYADEQAETNANTDTPAHVENDANSASEVDGVKVDGEVQKVEDTATKTVDEETGIEIIDFGDVDYHAGNDGKPIVEYVTDENGDPVKDENGDLQFTVSDDELNQIIEEKMGGFKADNRQPDPEPEPEPEPEPDPQPRPYVPVTPGPGLAFVALGGLAGGLGARKLNKAMSKKMSFGIYEKANYDFDDTKSFIR